MPDLFDTPSGSAKRTAAKQAPQQESYTAEDIEVLEGLEPVRRRPGMYVGGTDENALHHLVAEVLDNAMDEAVAGHATRIELEVAADGCVTVRDNGRGIPIDPHPKFPDKSALEVILTTLHSGGKFSGKSYETAGGLHGVGISVVNALSDQLLIEVVRQKTLYRQLYSRGKPASELMTVGPTSNRRGTTVIFHPDPEIFGTRTFFKPKRLYQLAKSKAYLFRGVEIRWTCDPILLSGREGIPEKDTLHFPNGLQDYLAAATEDATTVVPEPFIGEVQFPEKQGKVEWAIQWTVDSESFMQSYCNTIPTPQGGTHENGFRAALVKGLRAYGEMKNNKKAASITADDMFATSAGLLSVFVRDPQFQGQTKEKLVSNEAARLVENALKDRFDLWLTQNAQIGDALLQFVVDKAEERLNRKSAKDIARKSATKSLRLPGKLADCTRDIPVGTELFIVEGDSAGGSAKQARNRETQAILPIRGKILNVASATLDKIRANQEIADLSLALGCGTGDHYKEDALRYEKVVIMTDADVDGAHIATLLMTFFFQQMPQLIENGHLYLAQPPLYRITQGNAVHYATDDKDKERLLKQLAKHKGNIEVGRFKGLGEMTAPQLKETTMNPQVRTLLKVIVDDETREDAKLQVDNLMGKKPELRFKFIQEQSALLGDRLTDAVDL